MNRLLYLLLNNRIRYLYIRLRYKLYKQNCNYGCDWVVPYGFVPEAGCPVHDEV